MTGRAPSSTQRRRKLSRLNLSRWDKKESRSKLRLCKEEICLQLAHHLLAHSGERSDQAAAQQQQRRRLGNGRLVAAHDVESANRRDAIRGPGLAVVPGKLIDTRGAGAVPVEHRVGVAVEVRRTENDEIRLSRRQSQPRDAGEAHEPAASAKLLVAGEVSFAPQLSTRSAVTADGIDRGIKAAVLEAGDVADGNVDFADRAGCQRGEFVRCSEASRGCAGSRNRPAG